MCFEAGGNNVELQGHIFLSSAGHQRVLLCSTGGANADFSVTSLLLLLLILVNL